MKGRILIVDDEFGLAELVGDLLAEGGYETSIAINGKLGLESLGKNAVDLVISDVMMPIMDGPQMARAMKANSQFSAIPIIMMTALPNSLPTDTPQIYEAVLYKPFSPEDLFDAVARLLSRR
jgi:CheY-like chemotaxis protein